MDAIEDILDGKKVDDLEKRMKACSFDSNGESVRDFFDLCYACGYSRDENKILNGEDPVDIYGSADWQEKAQENLRRFLDKYK